MIVLERIKSFLTWTWRHLCDFLGPVPGAWLNHINRAELLRALILALWAGSGVLGVCEGVAKASGKIFPEDADIAGLITVLLTILADLVRRFNHGTPPPHVDRPR